MADLWVPGIDCSFDELTADEAIALRKAGIRVYAQCLWTGEKQPDSRVISLRNAANAGMVIIGYTSVTGGTRTGEYHAQMGRQGVPQDLWEKLALVAVDVELQGIKQVTVRSALETNLAYGKQRCIYTSYNAWVNYMGNPKGFTDALLWNAYWDKDKDIDFVSLPYGGWTIDKLVAEQYTGGEWIEGQYADNDMFSTALLKLPEDKVASADFGLLQLRIAILENGMTALLNGDAAMLEAIAKFMR